MFIIIMCSVFGSVILSCFIPLLLIREQTSLTCAAKESRIKVFTVYILDQKAGNIRSVTWCYKNLEFRKHFSLKKLGKKNKANTITKWS